MLIDPPPPGCRVLIRDEEWIVRVSNQCDLGGHELECLGVSETVRHREALFLSAIDEVRVLDPKDTVLVDDDSPSYLRSRLYLEAKLRQTVPTGLAIELGYRGAMDALPFQLEPTRQVLRQLRPRFLIADSVGLGKTLEAGILVSELMRRGKARRMLVVTTKSMMQQFQKEFWSRFAIPLTRLDSAGIQRIRRQLPANHNPFLYHDKTIISVDTLKRDTEYRHYLENAHWDVILIDEAHNVSFKGNRTLSNKLAALLAQQSDALILLTATPHNGKPESFASLMRMLDPTALPRKADYTRSDVESLFVRRFKSDVRNEIRQNFPERQVFRFRARPSAAEERAFARLAELHLVIDQGGHNGAEMLFRTTLEKSLLSSPAACLQTVRERMNRLRKKDPAHPDLEALGLLHAAVEAITPDEVSKLGELVHRLKSDPTWQWDKQAPSDRLVVFTERIETLKFLQIHLGAKLGLKDTAVAILHGQLSDTQIQDTVEAFGKSHSTLRLLIASDVASEGINLHFQAHRLVHFDIPWSLMVFQQRNGRVDRYGQAQIPLIAYLFNELSHPKLKGDVRILEILTEKDEQAAKNIGDPSIFLGLYEEDLEVQRVARAIEQDESPEAFSAALEAPEGNLDWLDALMGAGPPEPVKAAETSSSLSLFASDFDYVRAGLEQLHATDGLRERPKVDVQQHAIALQPGEDLYRFLKQHLAQEMRPDDREYVLSADREAVQRAINQAREGDAWPALQLLWPLHPIVQWLDFKLLALMGRQRAPVLRLPRGVVPGDTLVLISAVIPNLRGQPVLNDWFAVRVDAGGKVQSVLSFEEVLTQTGLGRTEFPNARLPFDAPALQAKLVPALEIARRRMSEAQKLFSSEMRLRADAELARLDSLRAEHHRQLELDFKAADDPLAHLRARKKQLAALEIDKLFNDYREWVRLTLELDARAHLTVAAVLIA